MIQTNTLVKAQKITSFKRSLAVVIGINEYQNKIPKLQTARRDAEVLAQILAEEHQYDEVILITDETECKPTLKNLLTLLEEKLPKEIQPTKDDRLLFYFAGHGIARDSDKGPAGSLVPQDADLEKNENLLPMQKLHECLNALSCRHLLVILDCCFAGTLRWSTARLATVIPTVIRKEHYDRFIKSPAWQAITSAAHNQEALDTIYLRDNRGGINHSPFAEALFKALRGEGDVIPAAKNGKSAGDGVITATELYLYLRDNVETASNESQTPGIWTLSKHDRGEYIFLVPGADPKLKPAPKLTEKNNPYRGLQSFEEEHSQLFFGRKELVEELYEKVSHASRLLTVVSGISGSGKSSLVKAGLIPYLRQNHSRNWYILKPMRPSESPFTALARTLMVIINNNDIVVSKQLENLHFIEKILQKEITALNKTIDEGDINSEEDEIIRLEQKVKEFERIVDILKRGTKQTKQRLIVDYFDELNNLCHDQNEKKLLQEAVLNCLNPLSQRLQDPNEFIKIVKRWSEQRPGIRLLLVIDQFEELITLSSQSKEDKQNKQPNLTESQQFLKLLEATLAAKEPQLSIVVTLRSDFEPRFLNSEALKSYWTQARFPVRAMRSDELWQAIERPAAEMALYFEQLPEQRNPVDKLVDEVGQMPGALPLLSFTLSELYIKLAKKWNALESSDRALILDTEFDKEGGVAGSLTRRANQEYDSLPDDAHKDTMRRVMLRMVTVEGGESARRRVLLSELVYADKHDPSKRDDKENERVKLVRERLIDARLIVSGQETGEPYIEPAHDFLVKSWDKLQKWQQKEQEDLLLQRRLTPNALDWKNKEQSTSVLEKAEPVLSWFDKKIDSTEDWLSKIRKDTQERQREKKTQFLWNGNPYLDVLRKKLKSVDYWFNQVEAEFVQRSIWQRRRNVNLRWGLTGVAFLTLSGFTLAIYIQLQLTELREKASRIRNLLPLEPTEGLVLAIQAMEQSQSALLQPVLPQQVFSSVQSSLFSAVETARERNIFRGHKGAVTSVAFSPDGRTIVSSGEDGTVRLWNLNGSLIAEPFQGHRGAINSVAFSPDGRIIVSGGKDGTVRLWNLNGNLIAEPFQGHKGAVTSVAFSPDGRIIVSGGEDGTVRLWNLNGNSIIAEPFEGYPKPIYAVAFSPDGQTVVGGSKENTLNLWNVQGKKKTLLRYAESVDGCISSVAFNPKDSNTIVSGRWYGGYTNRENTLFLWNVKNKTATPFNAHIFATYSVAFSPDGQTIVSSGDDSTIQLRNINGIPISQSFVGHEERNNNNCLSRNSYGYPSVTSVAFSPVDQMIASGGSDGTVRLWDSKGIPNSEHFKTQYSAEADSVAFSPDGKTVATLNRETVQLWNFSGNLIKSFNTEFVNSPTGHYLAFSPDGKSIAVISGQTIYLWKLNGTLISKIYNEDYAQSIAFSPDGRSIAVISGQTIYLWKLNGTLINNPLKTEDSIFSMTFSNDGKTIVTYGSSANYTHIVQIWSLSGKSIAKFQQDVYYSDQSVWFDAEANVILTSKDRTFQLRDFNGNPIGKPFKFEGDIGENKQISVFLNGKAKTVLVSSRGRDIWLWNFSGYPISKIFKYDGELKDVAFSPDGKTIATASAVGSPAESSQDSAIRIWNIEGNLIAKLDLPGQLIEKIAFSSNGKDIVSVTGNTGDHAVQFWPGDWLAWLEIACNRLRDHPILKKTEPENEGAKNAKETCQKYVWNAKTGQNEGISMNKR